MFIALIIGTIFYYVCLFFRLKKDTKVKDTKSIFKSKEPYEIIGKSTYCLGQTKTVKDIDCQDCKSNKNLSTFACDNSKDSSNLLDIDIKIEYEDTLTQDEILAEEIPQLMESDEYGMASGITFEEMFQPVQALGEESLSETQQKETVQNLSKLQQSGLFDSVVEQLESHRQKISQMFAKYDTPVSVTGNEESDFDINNYM
ncbi:hypothetical protein LJC25_01915 [Bacteroidales bacterium OttesenSCG-928-K03]|nr:hypothetical protein [Bacteroidales bacterium OttesenSCG-928-L14]MDL2240180.1 hypothetical protein [Bacteroidales bacterium OttesenSCG-928-K22]MDL2242465.1 hypothetical protein [Bacteroidales bacterium OttesenSCG-928-K03]